MYLFVCDETNRNPSASAKFFIYGGLFLSSDALSAVDADIAAIRRKAGYRPGDELKFDSNCRPEQISQETLVEVKKGVIESCLKHKCRLIVLITPHGLLANQKPEEYIPKAADYVVGQFNYFLKTEAMQDGICLIDRFLDKVLFPYLREKSQYGLRLGAKDVPLNKIKIWGATTSGAGNINSAVDIVLGSFRYCVNNQGNPEAASTMIRYVISLLWRDEGHPVYLGKKGLLFRPKYDDMFPETKADFDALIAQINSLLKS